MGEGSEGMAAFLAVPPDRRLTAEDLGNLPETEQRREPDLSSEAHDRLVSAGATLTGATLIGGAALLIYGVWQLLDGGGALDAVLAAIGALLLSTHWGWVHVAEYVGLSIDEHRRRESDRDRQKWLETVQPYPRYSVVTRVRDDAATQVLRFRHRPVLTAEHTFTFVRELDAERTFDAETPAAEIAATVEALRHQAQLDTDRLRESWEAGSTTYQAALLHAHDDEERREAHRAAATALSEHINASLLEPPLSE
jgi:hypothetical protein